MKTKILAMLIFILLYGGIHPANGQNPQVSITSSQIIAIGDFIYLTLDDGKRVRSTPITISIPNDERSFAKTLTLFCVGQRVSWTCKRAKIGQSIQAAGEILPSLIFVYSLSGPVTDFRFDPLGIVLSEVEISLVQ